THALRTVDLAQVLKEGLAIAVEGLAMSRGEIREKPADLVLPLPAGLDLGEPRLLVLLLAGGEVREAALGVEARDPLGGGLEVQAQRALHRDLLEAEVGVVEDLADDAHLLDRLLRDRVLLPEGP